MMETLHERMIEAYERPDLRIRGIIEAQEIAKQATQSLEKFLRPGLTYGEIRDFVEAEMKRLGSHNFWSRGGHGALVLFGELSTYSGHDDPDLEFARAGLTVSENDIVTADLCPCVDGGWGDYTRSLFLVNGKVTPVESLPDGELKRGMEFEYEIKREMIEFVDEKTTFEDLYYHVTALLEREGYRNLDYHDNFGHSIENYPEERVTISKGVTQKIVGHGRPLSFEPHIARDGGPGLKYEDMYLWLDGRMQVI